LPKIIALDTAHPITLRCHQTEEQAPRICLHCIWSARSRVQS